MQQDAKRVHETVESPLPRELEDTTTAIVRRDVEPSKRIAARIVNRSLKNLLALSVKTLCTHSGWLPPASWRSFPVADGLRFNMNGLDPSVLSDSYVIQQLQNHIHVSRPIARFAIDLLAADMDIASSFRLVQWMQGALCANTLQELELNISLTYSAANDLLRLFPNLHTLALAVHAPDGAAPHWRPHFPSKLSSLKITATRTMDDAPCDAPLQLSVTSLQKLKQLHSLALSNLHLKHTSNLFSLTQLTSLELEPCKIDCAVEYLMEAVAALQGLRSLSLPRLLCPANCWERFCRLRQLQSLQVAVLVVDEDYVAAGRELASLRSLRAARVMVRPAQQQLDAAELQHQAQLAQQAQQQEAQGQAQQQEAQQEQAQQQDQQQVAGAVQQQPAVDWPLPAELLEQQRLDAALMQQEVALVEEHVLIEHWIEQAHLAEAQQDWEEIWQAQAQEEEQLQQLLQQQQGEQAQAPGPAQEQQQGEQGEQEQQAVLPAALVALMPGLQELQLRRHVVSLGGFPDQAGQAVQALGPMSQQAWQAVQGLRDHPSVSSIKLDLDHPMPLWPQGDLASLQQLCSLELHTRCSDQPEQEPEAEEEDQAAVAALVADIGACKQLTSLRLTAGSPVLLQAACGALEDHQQLQQLTLQASVGCPPAAHALQLPALPAVQQLQVHGLASSYALHCMAQAARYGQLQELSLGVGRVGAAGDREQLAAALQQLAAGPAAASLQDLALHGEVLLQDLHLLFRAALGRLSVVRAGLAVPPALWGRGAACAMAGEVQRELEARGVAVLRCEGRSDGADGVSGLGIVEVVVVGGGGGQVVAALRLSCDQPGP